VECLAGEDMAAFSLQLLVVAVALAVEASEVEVQVEGVSAVLEAEALVAAAQVADGKYEKVLNSKALITVSAFFILPFNKA
jgi:hypothetical protein